MTGSKIAVTKPNHCDWKGSQSQDPGVDVVADQAHAFHSLDAAQGRFVGLPGDHRCPADRLDLGFSPEDHHQISIGNHVRREGLGRLAGHVGTDLGQRLHGLGVQLATGISPGGVDRNAGPGVLAHEGSGHLRLAAVADTDKQDLGHG